jgi:hypothetical protein
MLSLLSGMRKCLIKRQILLLMRRSKKIIDISFYSLIMTGFHFDLPKHNKEFRLLFQLCPCFSLYFKEEVN